VSGKFYLEGKCEIAKVLPALARKKCAFITHYGRPFSIGQLTSICETCESDILDRLQIILNKIKDARDSRKGETRGKGADESPKDGIEQHVRGRKHRERGPGIGGNIERPLRKMVENAGMGAGVPGCDGKLSATSPAHIV
jgi:hypothetical protein